MRSMVVGYQRLGRPGVRGTPATLTPLHHRLRRRSPSPSGGGSGGVVVLLYLSAADAKAKEKYGLPRTKLACTAAAPRTRLGPCRAYGSTAASF